MSKKHRWFKFLNFFLNFFSNIRQKIKYLLKKYSNSSLEEKEQSISLEERKQFKFIIESGIYKKTENIINKIKLCLDEDFTGSRKETRNDIIISIIDFIKNIYYDENINGKLGLPLIHLEEDIENYKILSSKRDLFDENKYRYIFILKYKHIWDWISSKRKFYIEVYFNRERLESFCKYLTKVDFLLEPNINIKL